MPRVAPLLIVLLGLSTACDRPNTAFPQFAQDYLLLVLLSGELTDFYHSHIEILPQGPVQENASCSAGGAITASGSRQVEGDQLNLQLAGCAMTFADPDSGTHLNLTASGTVHFHTPGPAYQADRLQLKADLAYMGQQASWDTACAVRAEFLSTAYSQAMRGEICDRPVSDSLSHTACRPGGP